MRKMLFGAIAGIAATMVMTAAARQMFRRLPDGERYALPPREITQQMTGKPHSPEGEQATASLTILAHFMFGSAVGCLFALQPRRELAVGGAFGALVWYASYFGWIPAAGILAPADRHPQGRNLLMLSAHLVWGAALAGSLRELEMAQSTIFGPLPKGIPDAYSARRERIPAP